MTRRAFADPGGAPARRARRSVPGPATFALLVLLGALWGLHIVFAKAIGAEDARQALALLVAYLWATAAALVAIALARGRAFRPSAAMLRYFAASSGLAYIGPIFLELLVAPRIDASVFALLAGAVPLATVGIAVAFGQDRLSGTLAAALGAGCAAALALLGPEALRAGAPGTALPWLALALLVPLLYGAGDVYIDANWPPALDVSQVAAGEGVLAACWAVFLALLFGVAAADVARSVAAGGWPVAGLIACALGTTWLYFLVIQLAGAVFVSFASYVTIATGVIAGVLLFGERPGTALAAAALLVALALWLLNRDRARAKAAHG